MTRKSEILDASGSERFRLSRPMTFVMLVVVIVLVLDGAVLAVSTYRRIEKLVDISAAVLMLSTGVVCLCRLISAKQDAALAVFSCRNSGSMRRRQLRDRIIQRSLHKTEKFLNQRLRRAESRVQNISSRIHHRLERQ